MEGSVLSGLIDDDARIADLLRSSSRVAVLGIKPESRPARPAFYVPRYLQRVGYDIVPVPVYYPEVEQILGQKVFRTLAAIPGEIDIVEVFRRPEHIPPHISDILAKRPRAVWLQSGIRHEAAASQWIAAGIAVVQDRCMLADHERLLGDDPPPV